MRRATLCKAVPSDSFNYSRLMTCFGVNLVKFGITTYIYLGLGVNHTWQCSLGMVVVFVPGYELRSDP